MRESGVRTTAMDGRGDLGRGYGGCAGACGVFVTAWKRPTKPRISRNHAETLSAAFREIRGFVGGNLERKNRRCGFMDAAAGARSGALLKPVFGVRAVCLARAVPSGATRRPTCRR